MPFSCNLYNINRILGVMVSVLGYGRSWVPAYKGGLCCFSAKPAALQM